MQDFVAPEKDWLSVLRLSSGGCIIIAGIYPDA